MADRSRVYLLASDCAFSVTLARGKLCARETSAHSLIGMVLITLAGMLVMPVLFDLLFFLVLRERFVLLHACMTIAG